MLPRSPEVQRVGRSVDSVGCGSCLEWDGGAEIPISDSMETVSLNQIYIYYMYIICILYIYIHIYIYILRNSLVYGLSWQVHHAFMTSAFLSVSAGAVAAFARAGGMWKPIATAGQNRQ